MAEKSKKQAPKKPKVMDVAKPGKSAPSASSRPIIVGHKPTVHDPMVNEDKEMPSGESEEHKIDVKRTGPKVIAPLSPVEDLKKDKEPEAADEPQTSDAPDVTPDEPKDNEESDAPEATETDKPDEDTPESEPETDDEASTEPEAEEEEPEDSEETPEDDSDKDSKDKKDPKDKGSSIVDAVAGQAAKNKDKKADKKNEELQKRLAEIEKLVDEKKYFVPTSSTTKKERKTRWVILLLSLLLLAGAYLAFDAQLIKNDYWLPYEFFKEQKKQSEPSTAAPATDVGEKKDDAENEPTETDKTDNTEEVSVQTRADDSDRKNEMKNLQQKLETYYNDNGKYPAQASWVTDLGVTTDDVTGPKGDAYVYAPSADQSSYVLTADLENDKDPDADSNGKYVLRSVNQ